MIAGDVAEQNREQLPIPLIFGRPVAGTGGMGFGF
jgi:hypothetical protein